MQMVLDYPIAKERNVPNVEQSTAVRALEIC